MFHRFLRKVLREEVPVYMMRDLLEERFGHKVELRWRRGMLWGYMIGRAGDTLEFTCKGDRCGVHLEKRGRVGASFRPFAQKVRAFGQRGGYMHEVKRGVGRGSYEIKFYSVPLHLLNAFMELFRLEPANIKKIWLPHTQAKGDLWTAVKTLRSFGGTPLYGEEERNGNVHAQALGIEKERYVLSAYLSKGKKWVARVLAHDLPHTMSLLISGGQTIEAENVPEWVRRKLEEFSEKFGADITMETPEKGSIEVLPYADAVVRHEDPKEALNRASKIVAYILQALGL